MSTSLSLIPGPDDDKQAFHYFQYFTSDIPDLSTSTTVLNPQVLSKLCEIIRINDPSELRT